MTRSNHSEGRRGLLTRIGAFSVRRRRIVLVSGLVLAGVFALFGATVNRHLSQGGFDAPGSQSDRAAAVLANQFHQGAENVVLVVTAKRGSIDSPPVAATGLALTKRLAAQPHMANVESYWSLGDVAPLAGDHGHQALIVGRILGNQNQMIERESAIVAPFTHVSGPVTVGIGGFAPTFNEADHLVEHGLFTADLIALPITFVLLLIIYGSLVAAALPVVVGGFSVLGALFVLRVVASVTGVSIFAEDLATALGLGLAIDYSLFILSRFREELSAGVATDEAVRRTVATAGKTVVGSSLTVAGALAILLVFPITFLRSFAYAGVPTALLAGLAAGVLLPAVLAALGPRVNSLSVWKRSIRTSDEGFWRRTASLVMRRPVPFLVASVAFLALLGAPFLSLKLGYLDYRVLPPADQVREVNSQIYTNFGKGEAEALTVVMPRVGGAPGSFTRDAIVGSYAARLSELSDVKMVAAQTGVYIHGTRLPAPPQYLAQFANRTGAWMSVVPSVDALTPAGTGIVSQVRNVRSPVPALVGGMPAQNVDAVGTIYSNLPIALGLMALVSFTVLLLMFRSLLIAVKALVLNVLSLSATFGSMVFVFQEGHFASVLGFTATGSLLATIPLLMFCVAFGLSMDYEVFLMSRIREQHDLGADNTTAVAVGLQRTGRIVTAAALTLTVVFLALLTSGISFIKLVGLGLTVSVLVDAFVVRGLLVPAFMRIAGPANWWIPRWLDRILPGSPFSEESGSEPAAAPSPVVRRPRQRAALQACHLGLRGIRLPLGKPRSSV